MKIFRDRPIRIILVGLAIFAALLTYVFWELPSVDSLSEHLNTPSLRITDRNGRLLYEILPREGGRHAVVSSEHIAQCMKDATIAVEDKHFYQNPGVDLEGIVRALWINIRGGETIAGGSTITQQVARNLLLQDELGERTLRRKLREAVLAWQMTRRLSKDEILALYLNQVNYGGMSYGVDAAARTYFGKPASELLLPECALLAGLPQAPGIYNPFTNPDLAKERQIIVLGLMEEQGRLSHEERLAAESAPLSYNPEPYPIEAPHFVWLVKSQLDELFASGDLAMDQSLVVRTTLDLDAQKLSEQAIHRHIEQFEVEERGGISHNVNNAALVVLNPQNGEVLALVGSADYFDASIFGALDMAASPRQTGSAFKPFIYALALENSWTTATSIMDVTTTFMTHDGTPYTPKNYDSREHGPVSVRQALGSSLNIPAVKTLEQVGIEQALNLARQLGITSLGEPRSYDLSLALGGGEISLLELSTAYGALANNGSFTGYSTILEISDADGNLLYATEEQPLVPVIDPHVAWLISDILSDDSARSISFGQNSILKIDRPAAVKTGTTTNFHDNWTIGYTPDLLVGVWVGNSNYEAMHDVTGLTGAAPIWHEVIRGLLQGRPAREFEQPDGIHPVEVCALSGLLPTPACQHTRMEWFIAGTEPTQVDTLYRQVWIEPGTNGVSTEMVQGWQSLIVLDLPTETQPWAREQGLPLLADFSNGPSSQTAEIVLSSPRPNTVYQMTSATEPSSQQLLIEALIGPGVTQVTFWVDGSLLGNADQSPYQTWWQLQPGEHRFWAEGVSSGGERLKSAEVIITVSP
ncbi:MAG: penicillin-binding protein 1C [Chloroflexota bacterium]